MKRGLILRPTFKGDNISAVIDPILIRRIILYWDIIEYPFVNGIKPNYDSLKEMNYLKNSGLIEESNIIADEESAQIVDYQTVIRKGLNQNLINNINNLKKSFWNSSIELFKYKNKVDKNTIWSIGDLNDDLTQLFLDKTDQDSILMEFYNFLPSPNQNTHIENILEFKYKRKDELLYLRSNLDDLSSTVCMSENIDTELKRKKEDIEKALLDLHRTLDETKFQKICSSLNIYLNINKSELLNFLANSGLVTLLTGSSAFGLLTAYGINVLVKIGQKKISKIDKIPDRLKNYLYVYNIEKKLT